MKARNFCSTLETETRLDPHRCFEALAIDAALLAVNDQLPSLSDEEQQRILDAAQVAAQAVLTLAHVPTDWLSFLEALRDNRAAKLNDQLHGYIFDLLPPRDDGMSEAQMAALARVQACTAPKKFADLHSAMMDLELAYALEVNKVIEEAFTLGYQIAHDPTPILFKKAGA